MSNSVSKCVVTLSVSFSDEWKNCIFGKRAVGEETLAASRRSDSAEAAREQPPGRDPALRPRCAHGYVCPLGFHRCSCTLFGGFHRFGVIFLSPKLYFKNLQTYRKVADEYSGQMCAVLLGLLIVNLWPCLLSPVVYVLLCVCAFFPRSHLKVSTQDRDTLVPRTRTFSYTATMPLIHPRITTVLVMPNVSPIIRVLLLICLQCLLLLSSD